MGAGPLRTVTCMDQVSAPSRVPRSHSLGPPRNPRLFEPREAWTVIWGGLLGPSGRCVASSARCGPTEALALGLPLCHLLGQSVAEGASFLSAVLMQGAGKGRRHRPGDRGWPQGLRVPATLSPRGKTAPHLGQKH